MQIDQWLKEKITRVVMDCFPEVDITPLNLTVEVPNDTTHGDLACNVALMLAKPLGQKPRDIALQIQSILENDNDITSITVAGPGFLNFVLPAKIWQMFVPTVLKAGLQFGSSTFYKGQSVNVEYVSANPTGPMHAGHVRGAVVGDVLARLLAKTGYKVAKEYYINDAGGQVDQLARSLHYRYLECLGTAQGPMGDDLYPGEYLIPAAKDLVAKDGPKWRDATEATWLEPLRVFAVDAMMALIKNDLQTLDIHHDIFFSEKSLDDGGQMERMLQNLERKALVYEGILEAPKGKVTEDWESRPQLLFRATEFGDDGDRPLKKSDGSWTYFARDIAYHYDKIERGFDILVDYWGVDHGGYVKRMQGAVQALSDGKTLFEARLCSLVNYIENGRPLKMSKRSGTFITLQDILERVGADVIRFFMLIRKESAPMDFDMQVVLEESKDNPVFYVQYAHARIHSVIRQAEKVFPQESFDIKSLATANVSLLDDPHELAIMKLLATWPRVVLQAAEAREPHRIPFYLNELATLFHRFWNVGREATHLRYIIEDNLDITCARLALNQAVASVIAEGLDIIGITPKKTM